MHTYVSNLPPCSLSSVPAQDATGGKAAPDEACHFPQTASEEEGREEDGTGSAKGAARLRGGGL